MSLTKASWNLSESYSTWTIFKLFGIDIIFITQYSISERTWSASKGVTAPQFLLADS